MIIPEIRWPKREEQSAPKLDMGQGEALPAEDVLDGHFRRLFRRHTVEVQTDDSLKSAITVLAPDLAPLTDLAEDLADAVPDVQPEEQFRQDLHRALELTHRQHTAQRALGTEPFKDDATRDDRPLFVAFGLICLASLVLLLWGRRSAQTKND